LIKFKGEVFNKNEKKYIADTSKISMKYDEYILHIFKSLFFYKNVYLLSKKRDQYLENTLYVYGLSRKKIYEKNLQILTVCLMVTVFYQRSFFERIILTIKN